MSLATRRVTLLLMSLVLASPALAVQQGLSAQFRQFDTHQKFDSRPFVDGDFGYGLAYEIRDEYGFWQVGSLYTPDAGDRTYDYAVTPFLNLFLKDRIFLAGVGIAKNYLPKTDTNSDDWTPLYWNARLGLELPIGPNLALTGMAVYDFERWGDINKFKFDDAEFAAAVSLLF